MSCPASGLGADAAPLQQPSHGYTMLTVCCCSLLPAKQENEKKSGVANRRVLTGMFRRLRVRMRLLGHAALVETESWTDHGVSSLFPNVGNQTSSKPAVSIKSAASAWIVQLKVTS